MTMVFSVISLLLYFCIAIIIIIIVNIIISVQLTLITESVVTLIMSRLAVEKTFIQASFCMDNFLERKDFPIEYHDYEMMPYSVH